MSNDMAISEAATDDQRSEVQALFERSFRDIAQTAVPSVEHDGLYAPIVLAHHDPETGRLTGAALTCRAQVAVSMSMFNQGDYGPVMDRHSELDLMAVDPKFRGRGIGSELVKALESRLQGRGVRLWFGNVTPDLETDKLRTFYARHGFRVLPEGQPLPDFMGRSWQLPTQQQPAFFFYKQIRRG